MIAALGLSLAVLPCTFDVDIEQDLAVLVATLAPCGEAAPATWQALRALGLAYLKGGACRGRR